jgi:hypothetical protein
MNRAIGLINSRKLMMKTKQMKNQGFDTFIVFDLSASDTSRI